MARSSASLRRVLESSSRGSGLAVHRVDAPPLRLLVRRKLERDRPDPPATEVVDRGVPRDPERPGREAVLRVVGVERRVDLEEDLLGHVAGVLGIAEVARHETEEAQLVAVDENAVEILVASEDPGDRDRHRRARRGHPRRDPATPRETRPSKGTDAARPNPTRRIRA